VKSNKSLESVEDSRMNNEIENFINIHHPCIFGPIGLVIPIESGSSQEFKIVRLYLEGCSQAEVQTVRPIW
jgi:hypothetical protein